MSRALLFLVIFAAGCRCNGDRLIHSDPRCGQPCSEVGSNLVGKGQCTLGRWDCPDDAGEPTCVGYGKPAWETCDGIDNDCDGKVDLFYEPCTNSCGTGTHGCRDGAWGACWKRDSFGFMEELKPKPEECNAKDDDCDGEIDEVADLPVQYCYDGPAGTLVPTAECHPGFRQCVYGSWLCNNQQLPAAEVCDGRDNDCDGAIDDGLGHQYDFLFCIDTSGSMQGTINQVQAAVAAFAYKYNSPDHRFALCRIDHITRNTDVWIMQNFTTPGPFIAAVNQLSIADGMGDEASMDALWYASQPAPYKLVDGGTEALNWRAGARKYMLLFSDEPAHAFDPATPVAVDAANAYTVIDDGTQEVAVDLAIAGVHAHVWTGLGSANTYNPAMPALHDIYSSTLQSDLNAVLGAACQ